MTKKKKRRQKRIEFEKKEKKEIENELKELEIENEEEEKNSLLKKEYDKKSEISNQSEKSESEKSENEISTSLKNKKKKEEEKKKLAEKKNQIIKKKKDEMDKNLANYLKLSYYIEEKKIRNALIQNEVEKKEIDKPTEARLIKRLKELDKELIPRNKKYFFSGVQIITLTDINNRENVNNSKNKKMQQGLSNMTVKKIENIANEELREMPDILDNVIKNREISKKNYAQHESNFVNNIETPKDTLTPTTQGNDDCIIF